MKTKTKSEVEARPMKTFVFFLYFDDISYGECKIVEVPGRNVEGLQIPSGVTYFYFFDAPNLETAEEITGQKYDNPSVWYFPNAHVLTRKEVKQKVPDSCTRKVELLSDMKKLRRLRAVVVTDTDSEYWLLDRVVINRLEGLPKRFQAPQ